MSAVEPSPQSAIIEVRASVDAVRIALLGLGAQPAERRSVALTLGDHLLLLGPDVDDARATSIALGGAGTSELADWLLAQLSEALHCRVREIGGDQPSSHPA